MSLISGSESKFFTKGVIGRVRKAQEDNYSMKLGTPNGDLFVVCDGMGGHVGGAMASSMAVESILSYINQERYDSPIDALDGALQFANMQILGYADAHPEYKGMGTTACIVLIRDTDVWIAHVGDSRIYLYLGKEKQLHRITKDHSYVQTLVDAGEITDEQAEHHANKNRITKALGIKPELHPTFNYENKPIFVKNGDIFLICTDGLSGMIPDSTIERVLGEKLTIQQKGDKLIELAMEGETVKPGGQDNCTLELIEIDKGIAEKSVFHSFNPSRPVKEPPTNKTTKKNEQKNKIKINKEAEEKYPSKSVNWKRIGIILVIVLASIAVIVGVFWFLKSSSLEKLKDRIEMQKEIVKNDSVEMYNAKSEMEDYCKIYLQTDSLYKEVCKNIKSNKRINNDGDSLAEKCAADWENYSKATSRHKSSEDKYKKDSAILKSLELEFRNKNK